MKTKRKSRKLHIFPVLLVLICGAAVVWRFALLSVFLFGIFDDPLYSGQNEVLFWLLTGML